MDNWGDPWADDAELDSKTPQMEHVKLSTPLPTTSPALFNEVVDEAQWGNVNDDGRTEGWRSPAQFPEPNHPLTTETSSTELDYNENNGLPAPVKDEEHIYNGGWGIGTEEHSSLHSDRVISESSDSATTVQGNEVSDASSRELTAAERVDDDASTRSSASPSDHSHTEPHTESPRTSFEDEHVEKAHEPETRSKRDDIPALELANGEFVVPDREVEVTIPSPDEEDEFGNFEEEGDAEPLPDDEKFTPVVPVKTTSALLESKRDDSHSHLDPDNLERSSVPTKGLFQPDLSLVEQIFPIFKSEGEVTPLPDDPISTTSQRKAWYRLTRKQTMREFNTGKDDDSYVRVTWMNSEIRSKATQIVARWVKEDRMSARGQAAAGTFFWDQPAPQSEPQTSGKSARKKPSLPISTQIRPATQNARPESFGTAATTAAATAQFNWSTSPVAAHAPQDKFRPISPGHRSFTSPLAAGHRAVSGVRGQEGRSASIDLTARMMPQNGHKRTTTVTNAAGPAPVVPSYLAGISISADSISRTPSPSSGIFKIPPPPSSGASTPRLPKDTDPWISLERLETSLSPAPSKGSNGISSAMADDDEDWGEMVQSPSVNEFEKQPPMGDAFHVFPPALQPTTTSAPSSVRSASFQTPTPRRASPIVRLKGTMSPTTANFKFNSFIPANTKPEPIGRGILRKASSHAPETLVKDIAPSLRERSIRKASNHSIGGNPNTEFSSFESSATPPGPLNPPNTPPPPTYPLSIFESAPLSQPSEQITTQQTLPSLFDADFSIFESAPAQPATQAHSQPKYQVDPEDPFSVFETTKPIDVPSVSVSVPPSRSTSVGMPSVASCPKGVGMGTGACAWDSVERREEEEEEVARKILRGLPDLGYMLRK